MLMLEQNRLYRRIENRNIFRTLSRTYSRQQPQRSGSSLHPHIYNHSNTSSFIPAQGHLKTQETLRSHTANNYINRPAVTKGSTAPINLKTDMESNRYQPFSRTVNIDSSNARQMKGQNCAQTYSNPALFIKRRESDSLLSTFQEGRRGEMFKLKSCMLRDQEEYEKDYDQSEYSILELERRDKLAKKMSMKLEIRRKENVLRPFKVSAKATKKAAAHLFSRYAYLMPQKEGKTTLD